MSRQVIEKLLLAAAAALAVLAGCYRLANYNIVHTPAVRQHAIAEPILDDLFQSLNNFTHKESVIERGFLGSKPTVWDTALKRGCMLYSCMYNPKSCPQTEWKSHDQLGKWGWEEVKDPNDKEKSTQDRIVYGLDKMLEDEDMQPDIETTTIYRWENDQEVTHDGVKYPPSKGSYRNMYDPTRGFIIAYLNYSPNREHQSKSQQPNPESGSGSQVAGSGFGGAGPGVEQPITKLTRWSDVVWLVWASITTTEERKNLKKILRTNIQNEMTKEIIHQALKKEKVKDGTPVKWPGHTFAPSARNGLGMPAFQAMLGTPNVLGVAWLLIQHSGDDELGHKVIQSIRVWDPSDFKGNTGWALGMLIRIGPA